MAQPLGRPPKFTNPEELWDRFVEYKTLIEESGEIPDVEGFCNHIDSYRDLFSEYEKKELFSDTIKRIKNWLYYKKKQLAMQNKMPAAIFIFDAKNNFGYVEKQEIDQHLSGEVITGVHDPALAEKFSDYLKNETKT